MTNKFDSSFERIERAFRKQAEISPDAKAKKEAFARAMEAFNEKKLLESQGIETDTRLTDQKQGKSFLFDWRQKMKTINSKFAYSLMGGASIAVLAMFVVAPNLINELNFPKVAEQAKVSPAGDTLSQSEPTANNRTKTKAPEVLELTPITKPAQRKSADQVEALFDSPAAGQDSQDVFVDAAPQISAAPQREMVLSQPGARVAKSKRLTRIAPAPEIVVPQYGTQNRDEFENVAQNEVKLVADNPVSTFSVDVDTASYSFMRSSLNNNTMPPADSIRIEELINYFDYDYAVPTDKSKPFKANVEIMPTPWNEGTKLMSIGIKGYDLTPTEQPNSNLVFLIDTSGSMRDANKLPLLRSSFKLLLDTLKLSDTVSIVTYAGSAGTVLEPTNASDRAKIMSALDRLSAGGSTAGVAGIRQAYALAEQNLDKDGVNRVILATDGDFNVGISDPEQLKTYIAKKRETGVSLSVLGFGRGNYNDHLMQKLAQNGNGNASYIDTLSEARKVLVEEAGSTLFTIAKDVKLQVEFNPALVSEYRLIGYETRALKREDFNNDKVDAGDIGAGHTVTALYEITPVGSSSQNVDPLRYNNGEAKPAAPATGNPNEYGFLKIRYKLPDSDTSTLISLAVTKSDEVTSVANASQNTRFAASVAGFGGLLKGAKYTGSYSYDNVIALAQSAKGEDQFGYRSEFINLVRMAESIEKLQ